MPSLYEKRLFRIGDGGLAVYIPQAWARYYGLKPKDVVIVVVNGELTIRPKKSIPKAAGKILDEKTKEG